MKRRPGDGGAVISQEADFYGAMDGASKFVRGDAIAGLVITGINILGGFIIGVLQQGMPIVEAAQTYTILTVGDGLVSQIPALLVSLGRRYCGQPGRFGNRSWKRSYPTITGQSQNLGHDFRRFIRFRFYSRTPPFPLSDRFPC